MFLSCCLAVVLVALGRQAAWRPGAFHDVHIFHSTSTSTGAIRGLDVGIGCLTSSSAVSTALIWETTTVSISHCGCRFRSSERLWSGEKLGSGERLGSGDRLNAEQALQGCVSRCLNSLNGVELFTHVQAWTRLCAAQLMSCVVIMPDEPSGHRITSGGLRTGSNPSRAALSAPRTPLPSWTTCERTSLISRTGS